ncbi:hypothetical protein BH11GEM1_BH11GEM1_19730 [soil metagenome]
MYRQLWEDRFASLDDYLAPPDMVFDAWTKPEHVVQWWDPSRRPLARGEIDVRPGGAFRFEHQQSADGQVQVFAGVYRESTRPTSVVFATPSVSGGESIGTLQFREPDMEGMWRR